MSLDLVTNVSGLPLETFAELDRLVSVLQALGIVAIVYFVYMIIMAIMNFRKMKRLNIIEDKIDGIEEKLDLILKKKKR